VTSLEREVVLRKLASIQRALGELEKVRDLSLDQYRADLWRRKAVERFLQEALEAASDAAAHLLASAGRPAPADYFTAYLDLAELGVLSVELADELAPSAGLRNRLVHEYDDLDDGIVLRSVSRAIELLPRFVAAVLGWLDGR
jgi:uncharacterized protein YutE (UPF0331/DUF86 family)